MSLALSVTPNLPGLIHNINPKVYVGNISFMFNVAWLFGVCGTPKGVVVLSLTFPATQFISASFIYWSLSTFFPARETYMDKAILPDDFLSSPSPMGSYDTKSDMEQVVHAGTKEMVEASV